MTEQKYTREGLPILTEENLDALLQIWKRDKDFDLFVQDKIKENPGLYSFLEKMKKECKGDYYDFSQGIIAGAMLLYESFRRQAEANKLEKEFGQ